MMQNRLRRLWLVVLASLLAIASHGTDTATSDSNGIQDRYEAGLAVKFVPAMVLDSRDNVSPEPVSFIGAHTKDSLWVRAYDLDRRKVFDERRV